MKKNISFLLVMLFVIHFLISIAINLTAFSFLKDKKSPRLNEFGNFYIKKVIDYEYSRIIKIYANHTGIAHGYSFYSPNISDTKIEYSFYNQNMKIKDIVMMSESKLKFNTLMDNITVYNNDSKVRKNILESIYRNILKKNKKVNEIKVNLKIINIKLLKDYQLGDKRDSIFKINAYNIKNETNS